MAPRRPAAPEGPLRHAKPPVELLQAAFEKEVLRLQREVAALQARNLSLQKRVQALTERLAERERPDLDPEAFEAYKKKIQAQLAAAADGAT